MKLRSIAVSLLFFAHYAFSCTTIGIPDSPQKWVLKSYDWSLSHGTVYLNPKGLKKTGIHFKKASHPKWTSTYGSLTFNQHGRELPLGGINEAGLVIEVMWLDDTEYPGPKGTEEESLNELQWIQYHLDKFSTVKDVVKSAAEVKILSAYAKVHYMVCDTDGICAAIEFLEGKLVPPAEGKALVSTALTNDTYAKLSDELKKYKAFGGEKETPGAKAGGSVERFVKATLGIQQYKNDTASPMEDVMAILKNVGQGDYTKFNIAYDRKNSRVYFRTHVRPSIRWVDLTNPKIDFKCPKKAQMLNMNIAKEGDVTEDFVDYTKAANLKVVEEGLKDMDAFLPKGTYELVAAFPDTFKCE